MRRLLNVLVLALAVNFIALMGAGAWLYKSGHLDHDRVAAIREIVFPTTVPATQPSETAATTRPVSQLDELLARHAGMPAAEQVNFIRQTLQAQVAQLEQREAEAKAFQIQVAAEKEKNRADREALEKQKQKLLDDGKEAAKLASDKGFQDSLELYKTMPAKQVKSVFMGLDDPTVVRYLQAMEARDANRITKEFKQPEEIERLKKLLEKMRQPEAAAKD